MLFAVPDVVRLRRPGQPGRRLRPDLDDACHSATSYRNQFYDNQMGQAPDGSAKPNGVDFWWDQGGVVGRSHAATRGTAGTTTPAPTARPGASPACPSPSGAAPDNLPSNCANSPSVGALNGQVERASNVQCGPRRRPELPVVHDPAQAIARRHRGLRSRRLRGRAALRPRGGRADRGLRRRLRHPAPDRRRAQRRSADRPGRLSRLEPGEHRAAPRHHPADQGLRQRPGGGQQRELSPSAPARSSTTSRPTTSSTTGASRASPGASSSTTSTSAPRASTGQPASSRPLGGSVAILGSTSCLGPGVFSVRPKVRRHRSEVEEVKERHGL